MSQPKKPSILFRRREIWCPTLIGWALILFISLAPIAGWCLFGESILCLTKRESTDVLIIEGWIGEAALEAAAKEFKQGHYQWVVTAGGPSLDSWGHSSWSYAKIARDRLILHGITEEHIIMAPCTDVDAQRTRESALAVYNALANQNIHPAALNIFTRGAHARRSRLIYSHIFEPAIKVGVIAWLPEQARTTPWWRSTERSRELLTETIGYLYETLLYLCQSKHTYLAPNKASSKSALSIQ